MPVKLDEVARHVIPKRTVLLFGAGSSVPSGAPSRATILDHFTKTFSLPREGYQLSEIASLAEKQACRSAVIKELRKFFADLKPSGGIKDLPLYGWKGIYTTNYDTLVEQAYALHRKKCRVYSSNFDFTLTDDDPECVLFKLHGTIDKDICDGHRSRIILTEADYDQTEAYRQYLYDRLKGDLAGAELIIIGQSLADPDMAAIVKRAATINAQILEPTRITLLLFEPDEHRAMLLEQKGLRVAFGGVDEFFGALAKHELSTLQPSLNLGDPVVPSSGLALCTIDIASECSVQDADLSAMFNGWPATYPDIEAGFTFERNLAKDIADYFEADGTLTAIVLGAAGVGKSTASRQAMQTLRRAGFRTWEHKSDHTLSVDSWVALADELKKHNYVGALLIDDAHLHLHHLNTLVDRLVIDDNAYLKLVIVSTRNHWYPRNKTPNLYRYGREFKLSRLSPEEIERLLNLIERQPDVRSLVEETFSGFSREERRRRLVSRCEADMFVCLKNIFASEKFDDIVLREYAGLSLDNQKIYRHVAAMESSGVRVHRQLVLRLLGIVSESVSSVLDNLSEIVEEYTIDANYGIYGWQCRHPVISGIITKYKFKDPDQIVDLFERVIDNISPTYDIEVRTLRGLCNLEGGLARIPDRTIQNRLLRKMISNAPGERVPRHRLIRNLIEQSAFDKAELEIRVFNKDFGSDGPVHRYKIALMTARAVHTSGIMEEDRIAILEQARELAALGVDRYPNNKSILAAYAELGVEYFKRTGKYIFYDEAISHLKSARDRLCDPDINSIIVRYERLLAGHAAALEEVPIDEG